MGALWIAHVTVTDEDAYKKYAAGATVAIAEHGGEFIARGGRFVQLEGKERARDTCCAGRPNFRGHGDLQRWCNQARKGTQDGSW